jgi:hypothetical protein
MQELSFCSAQAYHSLKERVIKADPKENLKGLGSPELFLQQEKESKQKKMNQHCGALFQNRHVMMGRTKGVNVAM